MIKKSWNSTLDKEYFLVLLPLFFTLNGFVRYSEAIFWLDALKLVLVSTITRAAFYVRPF